MLDTNKSIMKQATNNNNNININNTNTINSAPPPPLSSTGKIGLAREKSSSSLGLTTFTPPETSTITVASASSSAAATTATTTTSIPENISIEQSDASRSSNSNTHEEANNEQQHTNDNGDSHKKKKQSSSNKQSTSSKQQPTSEPASSSSTINNTINASDRHDILSASLNRLHGAIGTNKHEEFLTQRNAADISDFYFASMAITTPNDTSLSHSNVGSADILSNSSASSKNLRRQPTSLGASATAANSGANGAVLGKKRVSFNDSLLQVHLIPNTNNKNATCYHSCDGGAEDELDESEYGGGGGGQFISLKHELINI